MIGLTVLIVLVVYIWAGHEIVKRLQTRKAKFIATAVYILIPTWDILPGYLYFRHLCATEGGIKIFKTAENIESILNKNRLPNKEDITIYGYQYSEGQNFSGQYIQYDIDVGGKLIERKIEKPSSRYQFIMGEYVSTYNIVTQQDRIEDVQSGAVLATKTNIYFNGGWVRMFFLGSFGPTGHVTQCPYPPPTFKEFFNSVLKPVHKQN